MYAFNSLMKCSHIILIIATVCSIKSIHDPSGEYINEREVRINITHGLKIRAVGVVPDLKMGRQL